MLTIPHGSTPAFSGKSYASTTAESMANHLPDIVPVQHLPSDPPPRQQWSGYGIDTAFPIDTCIQLGATLNNPEEKMSTAAAAALRPMKPSSSSLYDWNRLPGQPASSSETSGRKGEIATPANVIELARPPDATHSDRSGSTRKPTSKQKSPQFSLLTERPPLPSPFTRVPLDEVRRAKAERRSLAEDPLREGVELILDIYSSNKPEQGVSTTHEAGLQPDQSQEVCFDSKRWDRIARPTKIVDYKQAPCSKKAVSQSKKAIAYREAQRRASEGQETQTDPAPKSPSGKRKRSHSDSDLFEEGSSTADRIPKRRRIEE